MGLLESMASVFLTGGTGFVGRSLLRYFQQRIEVSPLEVCIFSRDPELFLQKYPEFTGHTWLRFCRGDLLDSSSYPSRHFDFCIHAAADTTRTSRLNLLEWFDEIVGGTRVVLNWCHQYSIQRVLYLSSGAVYGPQGEAGNPVQSIHESQASIPDPLNTTNVYGIAKRTAEHLCALYHKQHALPVVIARLFAFVGPDLSLDRHQAIVSFIRDALNGADINVDGDGTPTRTYLDQSDLAHWLWTLLLEGQAGDAYNVGSDEVVTILQLAHLVRDLVAPNKPVHIASNLLSSAGGSRYIPNIEKARRLHGLQVTVPLAEAILKAACAHHHP